MKEFLKKIKLLDHLQTELEIQQLDFVNRMRSHVDEGGFGVFSDPFEVFSSSKNDYKGEMTFHGFKIKRRKQFFTRNMNVAVATGRYTQKGDKLIIDTEINGFSGRMIPFYIFALLFYGIFLFVFSSFGMENDEIPSFAILFIILHAFIMLGMPYFMMRKGTKMLKHELERELYFWTK